MYIPTHTNIYQLIRLIGRLRTHVPMQHPSWQSIRRSTEKLSMMTRLMLRWFAGNSIPGACFEAALDTECVTDIEVKTCKIAEEPVRKIWTPRRWDLTSTSENKSASIIFYIVGTVLKALSRCLLLVQNDMSHTWAYIVANGVNDQKTTSFVDLSPWQGAPKTSSVRKRVRA